MKRLLGSALALVLMLPYQASAELLKNLKLSGQLDLQSQASRNVTDFTTRPNEMSFGQGGYKSYNDRINNAHTRLRLDTTFDLLDDVHAMVTLTKTDRTWGTPGGQANNPANANSQSLGDAAVGADGNANIQGGVNVDQAYFKIDKIAGVDLTLGRQFYGESGDVVIYFGPSDKALYGLPTNALDAARADWKTDWWGLGVTGIAGKITGSAIAAVPGAGAGATGDVDVRGFNINMKPMESLGVDLYVYNRVSKGAGALGHANGANVAGNSAASNTGLNDNLYVYGFKAKWEGYGFKLGAEFDKNGGENRFLGTRDADDDGSISDEAYANTVADAVYLGLATKLDASYTAEAEGIGSFIPWFNFSWGSGRSSMGENENEGFQSIAGDFRPGTIYGRFAPTGLVTLGSGAPCRAVTAADAATMANPLCATVGGGSGLGTLSGGNPAEGGATGVSSNGLNNRIIWGAGLKATPSTEWMDLNKLTAMISFWQFRLQRETDYQTMALRPLSTTAGGQDMISGRNGAGNGNKHIGDEVDFDFEWKHSDNVMFDFGFAGFRPGKYLQSIVEDARADAVSGGVHPSVTQAGINVVSMAYGDFRIRF